MTASTAPQIPRTRSRPHAGLARAALAILMPIGQFAIAVSGFAMRRFTVPAGSTRRPARCVGSTAGSALTAAAVGACLLTSCTGPAGTVAGPAGPAAPPATAWQQVLSQVGPDGSVSEQTALEAFVLAIGPLPGVRRPAGKAQVIEDGSGAVRWLLGYYSELTAAQRAAVRRLLGLPVTVSRRPAGAGHGGGAATLAAVIRPAAPASPGPGQLAADQALEQQAAAQITSRLGVKLTLRVQVVENPTNVGDPGTQGYTACVDAAGLPWSAYPAAQCTIYVNPAAHASAGTAHFVMVHEVFHCFEAQLKPSIGAYNTAAHDAEAWLIEGAAEWVGSDFVARNPTPASWWLDYLTHPDWQLFKRTYNAVGWFGHLYPGGGVSPWAVLPAMIRAPDSEAAYNIATASASAGFLNTEASVFFEDASLGRAWYQNGVQGAPPGTAAASAPSPGIWPTSSSPVKQDTVGNTGPQVARQLDAKPYADAVLSLTLTAEVTEITVVSGHARLRSVTGTRDYVMDHPGTLYLCTASGPCSGCQAAVRLPRFTSPGDLGLDGGPDLALVLVHGMSAKDLCDQVTTAPSSPPGNSTQPPPPPAACGKLPSLGPPGTVIHQGTETNAKFTSLTCVYTQGPNANGIPLGFILIETFHSRAAAAAFFNGGITGGTPVPGFAQPVRYAQACHYLGGTSSSEVCTRNEIALHGYRIDEIGQDGTSPAPPNLPTLAQTNALMRRLLAVT